MLAKFKELASSLKMAIPAMKQPQICALDRTPPISAP
jgi:hypothetical protein